MLPRIIESLYGEPWAVLPSTHRALGLALNAHIESRESGAIPARAAASSEAPAGVEIQDGLAIVPIAGIIGRHLSMMESCAGGFDTFALENQMMELNARADVHTILSIINSPGGRAVGMIEIAQLIAEVGDSKRTVAFIDGVGASGGYWFAAAHGEIYSTQTSVVGSIGVYSAMEDDSRKWEKEGRARELFRSGEGKARGISGLAFTAEDRAFFQARTEELGATFRGFVRDRRPGVSDAALNGDYMNGEQALTAGLIDGLFPTRAHLLAELLTPAAIS